MRFAIPFVTLVFSIVPAFASTWEINPSGTGDAPTIQAGIDSAAAGDTVLVHCGTYNEHDILMKSGVVLRGETGMPDCVVIDAGQSGRVITCVSADETTVIEGFTITGGKKEGTYPDNSGGGVLCWASSPIFRDCIIEANETGAGGYGAGMVCGSHASPTLTRAVFASNVSHFWGGGLSCQDNSSPTLIDCAFLGNESSYQGGGVVASDNSAPGFTGCDFAGNVAQAGGGVYLDYDGSATFTGCHFEQNRAEGSVWGGGAVYMNGQVTLARSIVTYTACTFTDNYALASGGAIRMIESRSTFNECEFVDNVTDEDGGAVSARTDPFLGNGAIQANGCRFTGNSAAGDGGAVQADFLHITAYHSRFDGNSAAGFGGAFDVYQPALYLDYDLFSGNTASEGGCIALEQGSTLRIRWSTFWGNAGTGSALRLNNGNATFLNSIIAFGLGGEPVACEASWTMDFTCCDIFGNAGGDWVGCLTGLDGGDGNFAEAPLFCYPEYDDFTLRPDSPCLPGNHPDGADCDLIGAYGEGCVATSVLEGRQVPTSWGSVKSLFR